jgi:protein-glutamine gamma-glutamyltransferase
MSQQSSFRRLTIYFGLFATIAAGLIGLGQNSWNLPILVGIASLISIIYTDILGWFFLHRILVYLGMIVGAGVAIYGFMNDANANRLLSVGNLLVYVQLPLMFQKKSKRVYEQWGVFLLLELVVAALVNDNVLYGVIMLPVLAIGCAAMMGLAQFASYLRHNESVSESTSLWARWLHWLGKEQLTTRRSSGVTLTATQQPASEPSDGVAPPTRWRSGILPTAVATLLFSVGYFYMLPRLHSGAFEGEGFGWGGGKIGFSDQISLQFIGKVLQNSTPAFRLSMSKETDGSNYRPNQPPYIRSTVVHRYVDGPNQGLWQPGDFRSPLYSSNSAFSELPHPAELDRDIFTKRDRVLVQVIEKSAFGEVVSAIPPFARLDKSPFRTVRRDWRIIDSSESAFGDVPPKRRYSFLTYAYYAGQDSPFLADMSDSFEDKQSGTFNQYDGELTRFPASLDVALPVMNRILAQSKEPLVSRLSKALYLEDYFSNSDDFKYSLSLTGPVDRSLDPIADFLINKKSGHCQFYASSLALLLRSLGIPTRLVIGFRPSEYNEIGGYFSVLQNHAHVWVEAYFTLEELKSSDFLTRTGTTLPTWATKGLWLRLDPTPAVEGSNAGGAFRTSRTQTLDAMQDLWTEMVMNMDKNKQGSIFSLFGESSEGSYANVWLQIQTLYSRMQSSRFIGGFLSPDRWFSWRIALGIMALGGVAIALWRGAPLILPGRFGRGRNGAGQLRAMVSKVDYYERAAKLLRKLGRRRKPFQTPREFLQSAAAELRAIGIQINELDLSEPFYARRFGSAEAEGPEQHAKIQKAIASLEAAVRENGRRRLQQA